jgi:hypothetical protein
MDKEQKMEVILMTVCAAQIVIEGIDEMEGDGVWSQKLKHDGKRFRKGLEKHICRTIETLYEADEEMAQALIKSLENAMYGIVKESPVDIIQRFYDKD